MVRYMDAGKRFARPGLALSTTIYRCVQNLSIDFFYLL